MNLFSSHCDYKVFMLFQYIQVKLIQSSNLFLMLLKIFIILEGRIVCFEFAHGLN